MIEKFQLSSEECEILIQLETAPNLAAIAQAIGRDVSVVSRQISRLSQRASVVEKSEGKWTLSPLGKRLAAWAHDAIQSQKRVLKQQNVLRIATTREFSSRILAPQLSSLFKEIGSEVSAHIVTSDQGVESLLLSGEADIGFDCGRPQDPAVRFQRILPEPFSICVSPGFLKKHKPRSLEDLLVLPHLQYVRLPSSKALGLDFELSRIVATFSDIGSVRGACTSGMGWSVLPRYAIATELAEKKLHDLSLVKIEPEQFGVWWLRSRKSLEPWIKRSIAWLKKQQL